MIGQGLFMCVVVTELSGQIWELLLAPFLELAIGWLLCFLDTIGYHWIIIYRLCYLKCQLEEIVSWKKLFRIIPSFLINFVFLVALLVCICHWFIHCIALDWADTSASSERCQFYWWALWGHKLYSLLTMALVPSFLDKNLASGYTFYPCGVSRL